MQRRGVVDRDDISSSLLRQFVYGCNDDNFVLKLRLDEKEDDVIPLWVTSS